MSITKTWLMLPTGFRKQKRENNYSLFSNKKMIHMGLFKQNIGIIEEKYWNSHFELIISG